MTDTTIDGILAVRKPAGWTSHDVVAKARGLLGIRRIGHTGTLDPQVVGVLPLCIGRATRMVEYIQELPKQYEATLLIGIATDTEDATGTVIEEAEQVSLTKEAVTDAIMSFMGDIQQIPPMFSAVKINGKRLYDLAREGKEVERKPRQVTIHEIDIIDMHLDQPHPEVKFRVTCSKGTYIRTLCVDIGKKLGFPATMKELMRTQTGSITLDQCLTLEQIAEMKQAGTIGQHIIAADQGVAHLPAVILTDLLAEKARLGQRLKIDLELVPDHVANEAIVRVYSDNGSFVGLFVWKKEARLLSPHKIFG
ncbi:tRNA pseudouridine(55) synthase TruB [Paenibacillus sp. N1-5-1-14]|uniref:tRNA pseudouridine(55) synthase TruB n=1 Tax=Paenibacillus radicibacter TaxID=2972488 RepID=UPI002158C402|nr:tRNA pseudouridine(55) synthase TruB [Paenibacillus radicibacter]MCR8642144.1 tRNA pseudouridine(55) synthase TruB [Paenibacillus radicibacter]